MRTLSSVQIHHFLYRNVAQNIPKYTKFGCVETFWCFLLQAIQFLALLSSCFSKYMPLLILDPQNVLNNLPVTLNSLLSTSAWSSIAESVASRLFALTERIYLATQTPNVDGTHSSQPIDESEIDAATSLLHVTHNTCVSLKDFLPFGEQLRLANMNIIT